MYCKEIYYKSYRINMNIYKIYNVNISMNDKIIHRLSREGRNEM